MFTLSSKVQKFTSPVNANIIKCTNIKCTKYHGEYHAKHSNLYANNNNYEKSHSHDSNKIHSLSISIYN